MTKIWKCFVCDKSQLNIDLVLACGQSFRWTKSADLTSWIGVLNHRLYMLKQGNGNLYFQVLKEVENKPREFNTDAEFLKDYFNLDVDLKSLYKEWSCKDTKNLKFSQNQYSGIRILKQDPVENLFSFICSQNNNISRITQLVEKLCSNYGECIGTYEGKKYYSFPTIEKLTKPNVEKQLRELSFGYRAKFISGAAKAILNDHGGSSWLHELRKQPYKEAHEALCSLTGVGAKVADCVCLMSLNKHDAVPIDTHMWQIASRDYLPHLKKNKTLTNKMYQEIGDFFRELHGPYAGWAHSVLFTADLKTFKGLSEVDEKTEGKPESKKRKMVNKKTPTSVKKTKK